MSVQHLEVIVEDRSMEEALREILPKIVDASFQVYPHRGKEDLLKRLPERLRGYAAWRPHDSGIVVVVDCDDDDCRTLKQTLEDAAAQAGLTTRTQANGHAYTVLNRIAIEELEAWYFGDWEAVRAAYPRVSVTIPNQAKYRQPDAIKGGTWEALERILQKAGYFTTGLRKIELARKIARHMQPQNNQSRSFTALHTALMEMASSSFGQPD